MILNNPKERSRFLRFAIVGTVGALIEFGVFNLLTLIFHLPAIIASAISFILAVISNFFWNRFWTYPESLIKPVHHQLIQFSIISFFGLGIRLGLFALLEKPLVDLWSRILPTSFSLTPQVIGHNLMLAFAILVVLLWNFFANRLWTYKDIEIVND